MGHNNGEQVQTTKESFKPIQVPLSLRIFAVKQCGGWVKMSESRISHNHVINFFFQNEYSSSLDTFMETLKTKQTSSTRAITMARVLTSDGCYNVIREKEIKEES